MGRFRIQDQRGQALVETALVLPIIIMLIFGIVEFGRIFSYHITLANAVREGARFAAVGPFSDTTPNVETGETTPVKTEILNKVKAYAIGMNTADVIVTIKFQDSTTAARSTGNPAEVSATYTVIENIPFLPPQTINIQSTAIMRVE